MAYGTVEVYLSSFLSSTLYGVQSSVSCSDRFTPGKGLPVPWKRPDPAGTFGITEIS